MLRKLSTDTFTQLAAPGDGVTLTNTGKTPITVQSNGRTFSLQPEARFSAMAGAGDGVFAKATAPGGEILAEIAQARYGVPV